MARQDTSPITCLKQCRKVSSEFQIEEYVVRGAKLIDNRLEEEVLGEEEQGVGVTEKIPSKLLSYRGRRSDVEATAATSSSSS